MKFIHFRKSDGLVYMIFEPFLHLTYWCLFRKVYLHNIEGIPADKPVIIAANHPTAFVDPIALCIYLSPPIYNMTRGDIFRKPWARKLMESVNMFPVFRMRDGYTGRDRNDGVFEFCQSKLINKQVVAIYVEGEHHLDKQVKPIQKGLARIAFETYKNHAIEDLQVVPTSTNYIYGDRTRDELKMLVGSPLFIKDYWESYQSHPATAINRLNADIDKALKEICYHIEDPADTELAEQLLTLQRNEYPSRILPVVELGNQLFLKEKEVLQRLNAMNASLKNDLKLKVNTYFSALQSAGLTDAGLRHPEHGSAGWAIFLALGALPAAAGLVLGWPLRFIAAGLTRKLVKKREFVTSVLMGLASVIGVFALVIFLLIGIFAALPWLLAPTLLAPILAWFAFLYRDIWWRYQASRKAMKHPDRADLALQRGVVQPVS